jgi:hypothetical protein
MGKHRKEREEKNKIASRRKFILGATAGAIAVTTGGIALVKYLSNPDYTEAHQDPSLRQEWLDSLQGRSYATKRIASKEDLSELQKRYNYSPPIGAFAATIPTQGEIGKGAKSTLYVYEECFQHSPNKDHTMDLGTVVENVIENHELIHADHYYDGLPGLSLELFVNEDRILNKALFKSVSEVVSHRSEHDELKKKLKDAKTNFIEFYLNSLRGQVLPHYSEVLRQTKNEQILEVTKEHADF